MKLSLQGSGNFLRRRDEEAEKKYKKGVDNLDLVRYNGGSLSKSAFPTSTKKIKKKARNLLRPL